MTGCKTPKDTAKSAGPELSRRGTSQLSQKGFAPGAREAACTRFQRGRWLTEALKTFLVGVEIGSTALESVPTKAKTCPPCDPAHPLLCVCGENWAHVHRKTPTGMFIAALLIIAPKWEQPKSP